MALSIASLLWFAAFAAVGVTATPHQASVRQKVSMQLHEQSDPGLVNSVGLPPASQWRLGFEQGRRLEGATHTERYQMVLAWFQHDILGLLCRHLQYRFCQGD